MTKQSIRQELEIPSIRKFMEDNKEYLKGRVLDFGCGTMPYRDLVKGLYVGYEKEQTLDVSSHYDCIMCNQVFQYLEDPLSYLKMFRTLLKYGYLVLTYPTHWEEVENIDYWRFTKAGMERLLKEAGFKIIKHEVRWKLDFDDFVLNGGYGCVAQAN